MYFLSCVWLFGDAVCCLFLGLLGKCVGLCASYASTAFRFICSGFGQRGGLPRAPPLKSDLKVIKHMSNFVCQCRRQCDAKVDPF